MSTTFGNTFGISPFILGVSNGGFSITDITNSNAQRLVIQDGTGNLGIGISTPARKLQIDVGAEIQGGQNWSHSNGTVFARLGIVNPNVDNNTEFGSVSNNDFILLSQNTERIRIFANGRVFIGSSPSDNGRLLRVNGTGFFDSTLTATQFIRSGGTSSQFLKADGSVDSNAYLTTAAAASTYVPYTGATSGVDIGTYTLSASNLIANGGFNAGALLLKQSSNAQTIFLGYTAITPVGNNTLNFGFSTGSGVWKNFTLSSFLLTDNINRTYTLPNASGTIALVGGSGVGTVTSVAALTIGTSGTDLSSSVANSTTTPVITLNVPTASAANRGALSAADWSTFNSKQNALNGTGFVKASGTTITYDNSTYYLASNPSGYITGNQTITLSGDVTGSGATSIVTTIANNAVTTAKINNGAVTAAKLATFGAGEGLSWAANTDGASIKFESTGDGGSGGRALSNLVIALIDNADEGLRVTSDNVELFFVNTNQIQYKGNNVWHAGNLTNLNQLTNGPGYITGYTETDTLATVTGRGASTTAAITISREAFSYGGTTQSFLISGAGGNGALTINSASAYAYLNFAQGGTTKIEMGIIGAAGARYGSLYINRNIQVGESGASIVVYKSNGFVGINNVDPASQLDVIGTVAFSSTLSVGGQLTLNGSGTQLRISRADTAAADWVFHSWASGLNIYPNAAGTVFFGRDGSATNVDVFNGILYQQGNAVIHAGNIGSQSVNYASSAGNASTVGSLGADTFYRNLGFGSGFPSWDLNTVAADRSGFTYSNNAPWTGPFIHIGASGYGMQFNASYGDGSGLSYRVRNGDNAAWGSWRRIVWEGGTWSFNISGNSATSSNATNVNGSGTLTLTGKSHYLGASSGWDGVGFGNLTNLHFQGHNQFWMGAGNAYWFRGGINTEHDLLITTMQGYNSNDYYRGITFAVDINGNGSSGGYRLGRWQTYGTTWLTSRLQVDASLCVGYGPRGGFYSDGANWPLGNGVWSHGRDESGYGNDRQRNVIFSPTANGGGPWGSFSSLEVSTTVEGNSDIPALFRIHQWGSGAVDFWKPQGTVLYIRESPIGGNITHGSWFTRLHVQREIYSSADIVAYASDKRLKENYQPLLNALSKVQTLTGLTFDWKDNVQDLGFDPRCKHEVGVLAQEVQEVLPEAVKLAPFDDDGKGNSISGEHYLTVKYEKLVPLLIEAIKEQQIQIEELKNKLESLI
jgi:hypothetical protein